MSVFDSPKPDASLVRADVVTYAPPVDEFDNVRGEGRQEIVIRRFPIVIYTGSGAWINVHGTQRFVNLRAVKQYASASEPEARAALRARKNRQISILSAQLRSAERALHLIDHVADSRFDR